MNKKILTLVALSISLCLPLSCLAQAALAQEGSTGTARNEPTAEELKHSKERGLFIEQPEWMTKKQPAATRPATTKSAVTKSAVTKPAATVQPVHKTAPVQKIEPAKTPVSNAMPKKSTSFHTKIAKDKPNTGSHITVVATQKPTSTIQTVADECDAIITAWLNKPGNSPKYKDGEKMEVNVKASRDCNITIYDYDGKGKLTQIFPNAYQQNSLVRGGETLTIGGPDSQFDYQVSVQPGESKVSERIFIFAYPSNEAPLSIAMTRTSDGPFRSAEVTPEQYRKLVNESKVFFSREVKVVPKGHAGVKPVSMESSPNKLELPLEIEK
jgi:hypothetical protein